VRSLIRSRRIRRSLISTGSATYGSGMRPPKAADPGIRVEWERLRQDDDGWRVVGSASGPTWMPETVTASVIWITWVILGSPETHVAPLGIGLPSTGDCRNPHVRAGSGRRPAAGSSPTRISRRMGHVTYPTRAFARAGAEPVA
jgi:hypothetical protein